jgi:hypothetical protein
MLFIHHIVPLLKLVRDRLIYGKYKTMLNVVIPIEQPYIKKVKSSTSYTVGVSDKVQYLLASKRINVHDDYILASLENLPFRKKVFDVVILKSVIEYFHKHEGERLLNILGTIGHKLIIMVPNNGLPISSSYRYYRSTWCVNEFKSKGYKVHGLIPKIQKRPKFIERYFDYIGKLFSWYLPFISNVLVVIKKCK